MTPDRQNEIWAMLDADTQNDIKRDYSYKTFNQGFSDGYKGALENIFGIHNLTAQAEEKPKEPTVAKNATVTDYKQYRLDLAKEIAVAMISSNYSTSLSFDRYQCAEDVIETTNEIVKRLKETEIYV